ncbi:MAG: GumC family protein [Pseudomonadota bacterium]
MFNKPRNTKRQSLLTLAVDNEVGDRAERNKQSYRKEGGSKPGVLMEALGKQARQRNPQAAKPDVDIDAIERELNQLVNDVDSKAPTAAPVAPPVYAAGQDGFQPRPVDQETLLDPIIVGQTMWRWKWLIVACAIGGGVIGSMVALSQPKEFTSSAQVLLDPRELRLVERDLTPEFLSNDGALAIIDSQLEAARSTAVLEQVIARTNLDQDPEFNGSSGGGVGLLDGIKLVRSLFDDETPVDTNERVTIENLRDALETERSSSTFVVNFAATSLSPRKAARLANEHARAFIDRQSTIEADTANVASTALQERLASMEADVATARKQLADFQAANNLFGQTGDEIGIESVSALNATLVNAKAATASARARALNAQGINVSSVVSGAVPADLTTPALTTFRAQYASLRQNEAGLRETLGPRHPRLAVARASVEAARQDIENELLRIVDAAQTELERAIQSQNEIEAQLAASNADLGANGQLLGELRRLQSEVAAAESVYQNALVRSREAGEISALGSVNATILTSAEPALQPSSPSRRVIAVLGAIAGFLVGAGIAFLAGCVNSFRSRAESTRMHQTSAPRLDPDNAPRSTRNEERKQQQEPSQTQAPETQMHHYGYPYHLAPQPAQAYGPAHPVSAYPAPPQATAYYPAAPTPVAMPYPPIAPAPAYPSPPQPVYVMAPQPMPTAPTPTSAPAAAPAQNTSHLPDPREEAEIEELRQSVSDIREVLDHLVSNRGRRYG